MIAEGDRVRVTTTGDTGVVTELVNGLFDLPPAAQIGGSVASAWVLVDANAAPTLFPTSVLEPEA